MFKLVAFIICLLSLPVSITYAEWPTTPITVDFASARVPDEMQPAIFKLIYKQPATRFAVVSLQIDGDWALATLAMLDAPMSDPEAIGMGSGGALVVLHRDASGFWQAASEGMPEFTQLATDAPTGSAARTASLALQPSPTLYGSPNSPQVVTLKFPWDKTQSWLLTQGWHYGNNVDFAPSWATVNKWVLASHVGVVTRLCLGPLTANLRVTNPDGAITEYAHLDKGSVPPAILGRSVSQGQMLGKVYNLAFDSTQDPCGYSTGPHLHFGLPSQTVVVDGWQAHADNTWTHGTDPVKTEMSWFNSSNVLIYGIIPRLRLPVIRR